MISIINTLHKSILFVSWTICSVQAFGLTQLTPHLPNRIPWAEQWFYYIATNTGDSFKFSFQILANTESELSEPIAYIHFVHAKTGKNPLVLDYYSNQLITQSASNTGQFSIQIPGLVVVDNKRIQMQYAGHHFEVVFTGPPIHYWPEPDVSDSPFLWLNKPPLTSAQYFIYSLGTPSQIHYTYNQRLLKTSAITYLDKGIITDNKAEFNLVGGIGFDKQLMAMSAKHRSFPITFWTLGYNSNHLDIRVTPKALPWSVQSHAQPCEGKLDLSIKQAPYKIQVQAKSEPKHFYQSKVPTMSHFEISYPILKSTNAHIKGKVMVESSENVWQSLETFEFEQGLLEFSESFDCYQQPTR